MIASDSASASSKLIESAFNHWKGIDWASKKFQLEDAVEQIERARSEAQKSKKNLIEQGREFRSLSETDKLARFGSLIKLYQQEVDTLQKRCTAVETEFIPIAQHISASPDLLSALYEAQLLSGNIQATESRLKDAVQKNTQYQLSLQEQKENYETVLLSKQQAVKTLNELNEELQSQVRSLKEDVSSKQRATRDPPEQEQQLSELKGKIQASEEIIRLLRAQLDEHEERNKNLSSTFEDFKRTTQEQRNLEALRASENDRVIAQLNLELADIKQVLAQRTAEYEVNLKNAQDANQIKQNLYDEELNRRTAIEKNLDERNEELRKLYEEKTQGMNSSESNFEARIELLCKEKDELFKTNEGLNNSLALLKAQYEQMRSELQSSQTELENSKASETENITIRRQLEQELEVCKKQANISDFARDGLVEQLTADNEKLAATMKKIQDGEAQLMASLDEVRAEVVALREEKEALIAEMQRSSSEVITSKNEVQSLVTAMEDLKRDLDSTNAVRADAIAQWQNLLALNDSLKQQIRSYESSTADLIDLQRKLSDATSKILEVEGLNQQLSQRLSDIEGAHARELSKAREEHQAEIARLKEPSESARESEENLRIELQRAQAALTELTRQKEEAIRVVLEESSKQKEDEIARQRREFSKHRQEIMKKMEEERSNHSAALKQVEELRSSLEKMELLNRELDDEANRQSSEKIMKGDEVKALRAQVQNLQDSKAELQGKLELLERESELSLKKLRSELQEEHAKNGKIEELLREKRELEKNLEAQIQRRAKNDQLVNELSFTKNELQVKLDAFEGERISLNKSLKEAVLAKAELAEELEKSKNDERIAELQLVNRKLKDNIKEQATVNQELTKEKQQIGILLEKQIQSYKEATMSNEKLSNELIILSKKYEEISAQYNTAKNLQSKLEVQLKQTQQNGELENQLKQRNSELLNELKQISAKYEHLRKEVNERSQLMDQVTDDKRKLEVQLERLELDLRTVSMQNRRLADELDQVNIKNKEIVGELRQLSTEKDDLRSQLEDQTLRMKEDAAKTEATITKFKQLIQEKNQLTITVEKIQQQLKDITLRTSEQITNLELSNQRLHAKLSAKEAKIEELKGKVTQIEESKVRLNEQLADIQEQFQLQKVNTNYQTLQKERDYLHEQLKEEIQKNDILEKQRSALRIEVDRLRDDLKSSQAQRDKAPQRKELAEPSKTFSSSMPLPSVSATPKKMASQLMLFDAVHSMHMDLDDKTPVVNAAPGEQSNSSWWSLLSFRNTQPK
eukprot:TRINITY_DN6360_c0_g1_i1.p1 TRINITY_DN6360_c0_g1~~TRINITY_DN6360_c0_g1_i1.p1  ORF type:complete len:1272 (+),score=435.34 TRINITY_DN6360_c0_g1_i1:37-3852(+)